MTGGALAHGGLSEHQVSQECAESNSKHNPAIVCHKQQPKA